MKRIKKVLPAEELGLVRVLLVDEDFGSIHVATSRLRSLGCHVTTSRDVSDAVNKIQSLTFDLIVCEMTPDKSLPIFDQFAKLVHKPLVVVTSENPTDESVDCPPCALGVLPKFFKAENILELITSNRGKSR